MLETEYKYIVGKKAFQTAEAYIKGCCACIDDTVQVNYYFDDACLSLAGRDVTLRIRQKGDRLVKEYKTHLSRTGHIARSEETRQAIDAFPLLMEGRYALKGQLVTHRRRYDCGGGLTVDFDMNCYLGACDYEIELECEDAGPGAAMVWIRRLGLEGAASPPHKSARFFRRWASLSPGEDAPKKERG